MKNRILYTVLVVSIILTILGLFLYKKSKNVDYEFVGKYEFEIMNDSLFRRTYLHGSFGYVIGDLNIPGVRVIGSENLSTGTDYIISLGYPVTSVIEVDDGFNGKVPVIAEQNLEVETQHLYIYDLKSTDEYRLCLP